MIDWAATGKEPISARDAVETTAQLALVAAWDCDLYQGFLTAGALDEAELGRFVAASRAAQAA